MKTKIYTFFAVLFLFSGGVKAQYCTPTFINGCAFGDQILNFNTTGGSTNITNNNSGCSPGNYSYITGQAVTQLQGQDVTLNMQGGPTWNQGFKVWIDWNNNLSFGDIGELVYTSAGSNLLVNSAVVTVPFSALPGIKRMRVVCSYASIPTTMDGCPLNQVYGECEDYDFVVVASANCTGTPNAGIAVSSASPICPSVNYTLSLTGSTLAAALSYQWQSAPSATGPWTNIATGTTSSVVLSQTGDTWYQCIVTCSGLSATSSVVAVATNSFYNCYCNSAATAAIYDEEIYNVTVNGGSTNPLYTNANGCTTVAPGPGSILGGYSNFKTLPAITSVITGQSVAFAITQDECDGPTYFANGIGIWVDFNQNGLFTDLGEDVYIESTTTTGPRVASGSFNIPITALAGNTAMRVICAEGYSSTGLTPCMTYGYGETEDYLINIVPASACAGIVIGGTTVTSATPVCPSTTVILSTTGSTLSSGITYQWQSAASAAGPWTNIPGATSNSYATTVNVDTYFQMSLTCTASGSTATSTPVMVGSNSFYNCYCNSAATAAIYDEEIYNVTVNGGSTNPLYTNANGCTTVAPGPGSILGGYSNFKTLPAITSVITGQSVAFAITQDECDGPTYYPNGIGIWVDFNQNGLFTDLGEDVYIESTTTVGPRVASGSFNIPITALAGNTAMRVICAEGASSTSFTLLEPCMTYGYGETEDYLINIVPASACAGTVAGGTTVTSATPVCPSTTVTLSTTGSTLASGITYQWQSAASAAGPWTNIPGATSNSYATTVNVDTYFQMSLTCTASGSTATSTPVMVGSNPFYNCYCNTVNAGGEGSLMDEVAMAGYVNNTAATNPTASPFYSAFTTGPSIIQGMSYDLEVTIQAPVIYAGAIVSVWIDYDHNGAYEPTEWTQVGTNIAGGTIGTVNIPIPITALTGNTGMRIRSRGEFNQNGAGDACTTMGSGETEDYVINILPAPDCANPTNIVASTEIDSILTTWSWSQTLLPGTGFNMQLVNAGSAFSTGTTYVLDNNFSDTLFDANFMAGQSFQMYLQAVCDQDTSYFIGPFNVVMPLSNDTICGAQLIPVNNIMYVFNNAGASIDVNETIIVPPVTGAQTETGWENQNLNLTTWFKFVAPASGSVRVNCTGVAYNGQAAVYGASTCDNIASFQLVSANDNDMIGTSLAPNFSACGLTPGSTYYILHDAFNGTAGNYGIAIKEIVLNAGVQGEVLEACYGDTVNLFNGIANYDLGGVWTQTIPTLGLQGNMFNTNGLASVAFTFTYTLTDGCANDSSPAEVDVYPPSQAGIDGTFTVCKNEPFNLLQGLGGIVDLGGTWYDPSNNPLPGNLYTAANIPGSYNFDYIVGNNVCPDDTSNVLVIVDGSCDFTASIGDITGSFEMYPNPTADVLNIVNGMDFSIERIQVLDMQGKVVVNMEKGSFANAQIELNIKNLQTGVYMVRVSGLEKTITNRVIKQ